MKSNYPPAPEWYKKKSDGASIPVFLRWIILYLMWVGWLKKDTLILLNNRGYNHDYHVDYGDEMGISKKEAREEFILGLVLDKINHALVSIIVFGLYIFDRSPEWLKKCFKRLT